MGLVVGMWSSRCAAHHDRSQPVSCVAPKHMLQFIIINLFYYVHSVYLMQFSKLSAFNQIVQAR